MRRILYLLVGACLALAVGFAGAYFTARTEVANSVIRGGTVAISAEPTSAALSIDALAPGSTVQRSVVVLNDGNLPVNVVVSAAKKAGISDFYEALTCRVTAEDGSLLVSDTGNKRLIRVDPRGGRAAVVAAGLRTPMGLVLEPSGAALVLEFDSHSLSRIAMNGSRKTLATGLSSPYALARAADGPVYVVETGKGLTVRRIYVDPHGDY
jgi:glucose/arabinose dehydrogenase